MLVSSNLIGGPSERLIPEREFGDTVVLILNTKNFLN